jgi:hypothetical protein
MMKTLIGILLCLSLSSPAYAQTVTLRSTNISGTIATTNTFQSIQAANNGRYGCAVQNNGTHTMYVFFGPIANATTSNSIELVAQQSVSCQTGTNLVLSDQVSITGTSGDAFFANFQ